MFGFWYLGTLDLFLFPFSVAYWCHKVSSRSPFWELIYGITVSINSVPHSWLVFLPMMAILGWLVDVIVGTTMCGQTHRLSVAAASWCSNPHQTSEVSTSQHAMLLRNASRLVWRMDACSRIWPPTNCATRCLVRICLGELGRNQMRRVFFFE